jgi:hypothetical protein
VRTIPTQSVHAPLEGDGDCDGDVDGNGDGDGTAVRDTGLSAVPPEPSAVHPPLSKASQRTTTRAVVPGPQRFPRGSRTALLARVPLASVTCRSFR